MTHLVIYCYIYHSTRCWALKAFFPNNRMRKTSLTVFSANSMQFIVETQFNYRDDVVIKNSTHKTRLILPID